MLTVIGAGFPRTGTTSLKAALDRLGFGPCYHMFEVIAHPEHTDRWLPVAQGDPVDWEAVFEGYRSAVDWPAAYFWRELADAYPDAKVILTVRDPRRWYTSFRTLITRPRGGPGEPGETSPMMTPMIRMRPVLEMLGKSTFGDEWRFGEHVPDEEDAVRVFNSHTETVRNSVPADRLLVFEASQGWGPLCDFLGVEPPEDEPFPHLNDSEWMRRMFERSMREGHLILPFDPAR
ncbi:sulfotransferase family protein [Sphaerisporangium album]|uniref:sulfotransferase family protein n=1 Tax=Sphaerisporangium album TaxID=509200 RepID=UPI0015F05CE0|nr:sulfotransferase family protein [Sphaerisporangium album]